MFFFLLTLLSLILILLEKIANILTKSNYQFVYRQFSRRQRVCNIYTITHFHQLIEKTI